MKSVRFIRHAVAVSLIALATPAVAQVAMPPLEAYGQLPAMEDVVVSPSGKLAMLATSRGKRILAMLDSTLKPIRILEVGDIKVRSLRWIGDEAVMVVRSQTIDLDERFLARNAEISNAMIVPVDETAQVQTIFADERMVHAVFGTHGFRNLEGKWIGLFAGRAMTRQADGSYYYEGGGGGAALYAVDVATNKHRRMTTAPTSSEYADWLVDPAGNVAATMYFTETTDNWRLLDARGRQIAAGNAPKGGASLVAFGVSGDTVIYAISPEHGAPHYYEVPLAGGEAKELWPDEEVDAVYVDPNTVRLVGHLPVGHGSAADPVFLDADIHARVAKVVESFRPLGGLVQGWSPDFRYISLSTDGSGDSGTWYLIDTVRGQANVVGKARPQIGPHQVGPVSTIHYKAQDGLEIEAVLTLPPGREAKGLPFVMLPHGGPRAHDGEGFDWWAQAFASRGYAVLQPNFRGSTEHGDDFMHAGDGQWGKKMQTDLSDGMAHLAEQGIIDPKRACIVGASYGGYAALAGVTLQQDLYRCAVSVAGVSDLEAFFNREYRESGQWRELRDEWLEMMGPRDQLATISPNRFGTKADAPVMLIHGRDDTVVPFDQSVRMADALKDAGKPYQFVELAGEDHWLSRSETRNQMLQSAIAFVQKHNPAD